MKIHCSLLELSTSEVFDKNAPAVPKLNARGPKLMSLIPEHKSYQTLKNRDHSMFRTRDSKTGSCVAVPREDAKGAQNLIIFSFHHTLPTHEV